MKYPLQTIPAETWGDSREPSYCTCRKADFAWWDSTAEKCAVLQLTFELDEVHFGLDRLIKEMPHEGQFRR